MDILNLNVRMEAKKLQKFDEICLDYNTTKEVMINELVDKLLSGEIKLKSKAKSRIHADYNRTSFSNTVCELLKKSGAQIRYEKYDSYTLFVLDNKALLYFTFRKMNNESPVFSVRGTSIQKIKEYASQHNLIPYVVSFCYAPLGNVWVFAELSLVPEAEPKNKTESYYISTSNQTLYYRVAELKDYQRLNELSKKSLSPELYNTLVERFGDYTAKISR